MDVVESLVNEGEFKREHNVMNEHESRVAHIFISIQGLSSSAEPMINTESKELDILQ